MGALGTRLRNEGLLLCHFLSAEALGRDLMVSHTDLLGHPEQLDNTTGPPSWAAGREVLFLPNSFCPACLGRSSPWWWWMVSSGGRVALGPQSHQILGPQETGNFCRLTEKEASFYIYFKCI